MSRIAKIGYRIIDTDTTTNAQRRYVSKELREMVMQRDGNACVRCGSIHALDIDHAVPVSAGGKSEIDNLQVLCRDCNGSKGARTWWGRSLIDKATALKGREYIEALYRQQRFR